MTEFIYDSTYEPAMPVCRVTIASIATGRRVIDIERAYNLAAGFTATDDRLPAFFTQEPLASRGTVFDVSEEALDGMWDRI